MTAILNMQRTAVQTVDGKYLTRPDQGVEGAGATDLPPVALLAVRLAVAAVDQDNVNTLESYKKSQQVHDKEELSTVEPVLDAGTPFEYLRVDRDGKITHLVAMVTDSVYRSSYRLAIIEGELYPDSQGGCVTVQLGDWDSYESPLIVGPWIYFTEYFDNQSALGYAEWAQIDGRAPWQSPSNVSFAYGSAWLKDGAAPATDDPLAVSPVITFWPSEPAPIDIKAPLALPVTAWPSPPATANPVGDPIGTEWDK